MMWRGQVPGEAECYDSRPCLRWEQRQPANRGKPLHYCVREARLMKNDLHVCLAPEITILPSSPPPLAGDI